VAGVARSEKGQKQDTVSNGHYIQDTSSGHGTYSEGLATTGEHPLFFLRRSGFENQTTAECFVTIILHFPSFL
jgi:hypothetical protein